MKTVIERRPAGTLQGVVEKLEYWTNEGRHRFYLIVSFIELPDGRKRAIEFFMPVNIGGDAQEWVTSSMRLLSLAARGGFLDRALDDMQKVTWDKGPVRCGIHRKDDGTEVPKYHDSRVAAVAYAIQQIIANYNAVPTSQPGNPS